MHWLARALRGLGPSLRVVMMGGRTKGVAVCIGAAICAVLCGPAASAHEGPAGAPELEVARIELSPAQPDVGEFQRSVLVLIETGYCSGELPPEFDHFDVAERQKTERRPYRSAVIFAYVRFPDRAASARKPCAGLGLRFERRVKLKRAARRLLFFDGSTEPPRALGRPPGA